MSLLRTLTAYLLPWLSGLLAAGMILAVAWLLWPALQQEQRPVPRVAVILDGMAR
jgi:hypothetical protein